ncbi:conserved unknown protein [Ectocarpus siliculosus]|uniref:Charged multivesicular body protein 5 n=1 Tax=Ectocarpus siliculosus TaxID=2880 RepID=D8LTZ1_ECTSI|nr:conserved unknown protein [Ectocarpus siliculosus]|eukprot:CBN75381.1 conserved unknown protein [Ectocarpus siliculosus]
MCTASVDSLPRGHAALSFSNRGERPVRNRARLAAGACHRPRRGGTRSNKHGTLRAEGLFVGTLSLHPSRGRRSTMKRVFGKKKEKGPAPSLSEAGGRVDERVAKIDEKIKGLDQELVKYRNALKKAKGPTATNIKKRAMETLKRKKMYEGQRDQMAGQQFNIEQTGFAIDSIKDTATTVAAMKDASKTLKADIKKIDINKVEDMTDDMADMMEDMNEINDIMGRSYNVGDELDEDDLDAELACLDDELDALEGLEEDTGPSYVAQPASLPQEPSLVPESTGPTGVDEFGLPVNPAPARPAQERFGSSQVSVGAYTAVELDETGGQLEKAVPVAGTIVLVHFIISGRRGADVDMCLIHPLL